MARASVRDMHEQLGGLDVLIHCVGINDRKPIENYTATEWDRIVDVNLTSAFHVAAEAAVAMRDQGRGRIVFFSSVAGRSGHKLHGPYAATKGAINQLMRVIAHEYAIHGVTANAVAPGYMDTELTRSYLTDNPDKRQRIDRADSRRALRLITGSRRSGVVPVLPASELHHRAGSVYRRRPHDRLEIDGQNPPTHPQPPTMDMLRRFEGRSFMVTGAGTGFGAALAVRAANEGAARVLVHYRSSAEGAERTAERVREIGAEALVVQGDITSWGDIQRMAAWAFEEGGGVDVLVNNVGDMASGQASWKEVTEEAIDHVLAVDIKGTMLMVHEFGQRMVEQAGGSIVNVGSTVIVRGSPRAPQYAAGKYGLLGITKSYAKALAPIGARQHVRARLHGDRGAAGAPRVAGRPARGGALGHPDRQDSRSRKI